MSPTGSTLCVLWLRIGTRPTASPRRRSRRPPRPATLDRAARLVASLAVPTCDAGRIAVVEGWLPLFAAPQLERYPAVALLGAWVHARRGRTSQARHWLAIGGARSRSTGRSAGWQHLAPSLDRAPAGRRCARAASSRCSATPAKRSSSFRSTAAGARTRSPARGRGARATRRHGQADAALALAVETAEPRGTTDVWVAALSLRAVLAAERGDQVSGDLLAEEARRVGAGPDCIAAEVLQHSVFREDAAAAWPVRGGTPRADSRAPARAVAAGQRSRG